MVDQSSCQKNEELVLAFRRDIEKILQEIDCNDSETEEKMARIKLRYQQRIIEALLKRERNANEMLDSLIQRTKEIEEARSNREYELSLRCDRLLRENIALKAKLNTVAYKLNQNNKIDCLQLLNLLKVKSINEFQDSFRILMCAWLIAHHCQAGKTPSKTKINHLAQLVKKFDQDYPDSPVSSAYREIYGK